VGVGWLVDKSCASWGWYGELIGEGLSRARGGGIGRTRFGCVGLAGVGVCSRFKVSKRW
jgi:hypothetical protein